MKLTNNFNTQIRELIRSQDIVRQQWANATEPEVSIRLRHLDKEITKTINFLGKQNEHK